jgi:secreted trypsin-like serine protease
MSKLKFYFFILVTFSPIFVFGAALEAATPIMGGISLPKLAIMAGAAPDSPSDRVDPNSNPTFSGVGLLSNGCTGTAITSSHILTAAHCGASSSFTVNNTDGSQTSYSGTTVFNPSASFPFDDLAILNLNNPLPNNIPTYSFYGQPLTIGTTITMVGYGGSGNGDVGVAVNGNGSVKRIGQNVVDAYLDRQQDIGSTYQPIYVFDFDGTDNSTNLIGGGSLGNSLESSLWVGDSGSPAFVEINGVYYLAGVNNFVARGINSAPLFGSFAGGVDISQYNSWINSVTLQSVPFGFSPLNGGLAIAGLAFISRFLQHRK